MTSQDKSATEFVLEMSHVSLSYSDGDRHSYGLRDVSIQVPERQFIGVMGPSGSGKSSLLYVLSGLKRATSGEISFRGARTQNLSGADMTALRRREFGFVFQHPWLLPWQTALENTLMGSDSYGEEATEKALGHLRRLGVDHLANSVPSRISGGEKQRVCVARALMNDPAVVFADEPSASLDHTNGRLVVDLLASYRDRVTVIVVTHDPEMLVGADRVLLMRDGSAVEWVDASDLERGHAVAG